MNCNNYRGISLLSTSYKILSNIILSRMTPYANEIIGGIDQPSTTYLAFGKYLKWKYNQDICQLFIDFEKAYDL